MLNLKKILGRNLRSNLMFALSFLPNKLYIRLFYLATTGKTVNFKNPLGFNEKLQYLKLHNKNMDYGKLVDKFAVRENIKELLGEEYLFPLLGSWEKFDDIDFSALPEQFVLKCNHDSGSTKVIKSKSSLTEEDFKELRKHFTKRLRRDYYYASREYPYKGISPRIIAEQMMIDKNKPESSIEDYKFYCFNGEPKMVLIVTDRSTDCRFDFFDMDFNHLDIVRSHPNSDKPVAKPQKFDELKAIATKLSQNKRFVRIDLYEINGRIYFGEYTFFPGGGFQLFQPPQWERRLGDWLDIN